jgi:hypothetical protein
MMQGTASTTASLRLAVVTTALLAAGSVNALAQTLAPPTPESFPGATPPDSNVRRPAAQTTPGTVWLLDNPKARSVFDSLFKDVEVTCLGCPGFGDAGTSALLPESTNPNAPRVLQGKWRQQTAVGLVSLGFVGVRNYALPLYVAMPLAGDFNPGLQSSSSTSAFAPSSQWSLSAAIEKTLASSWHGASIGAAADVIVPVETKSTPTGDARAGATKARAARFGFVFR